MSIFKTCKDGVHSYEPRYDEKYNPEVIKLFETMDGNVKQLRDETYIHDICVRCGDVVKPDFVNACESMGADSLEGKG